MAQLVKLIERLPLPIVPPNLEIGREIDRGAWGAVHEGELDGELVAVKKVHQLLKDSKDGGNAVHRFFDECERLHDLYHPHVIKFRGAFKDEELGPILVMERMNENLRCFLERNRGRLTIQEQIRISHEITQGVAFLHQLTPPMVHRDLNSKNVMFTFDGVAKIGDFGQSKLKQDLYLTSAHPGMLLYMPPEALDDKNCKYDESLDIFSLGVLMLEIGTQQQPTIGFVGIGAIPEIKRRAKDLQKMVDLHPLKPFILLCLNNDRKQRPKAAEMRTVLSSLKKNMLQTILAAENRYQRMEAEVANRDAKIKELEERCEQMETQLVVSHQGISEKRGALRSHERQATKKEEQTDQRADVGHDVSALKKQQAAVEAEPKGKNKKWRRMSSVPRNTDLRRPVLKNDFDTIVRNKDADILRHMKEIQMLEEELENVQNVLSEKCTRLRAVEIENVELRGNICVQHQHHHEIQTSLLEADSEKDNAAPEPIEAFPNNGENDPSEAVQQQPDESNYSLEEDPDTQDANMKSAPSCKKCGQIFQWNQLDLRWKHKCTVSAESGKQDTKPTPSAVTAGVPLVAKPEVATVATLKESDVATPKEPKVAIATPKPPAVATAKEPGDATWKEPAVATATPKQPAIVTPKEPAVAVATPKEQAVATPKEPAVGTPKEQAVGTPKEQAVATPKEPAVATPTEPAVATPKEQAVATPKEPAVATPKEPAVATPKEQAVATPKEQAVAMPKEPAVATPTEPAVATPKEPAVATPKEQAVAMCEAPDTVRQRPGKENGHRTEQDPDTQDANMKDAPSCEKYRKTFPQNRSESDSQLAATYKDAPICENSVRAFPWKQLLSRWNHKCEPTELMRAPDPRKQRSVSTSNSRKPVPVAGVEELFPASMVEHGVRTEIDDATLMRKCGKSFPENQRRDTKCSAVRALPPPPPPSAGRH